MIDPTQNGYHDHGAPAGGPLAAVVDGGRDARGRFAPGNTAARGNPLARQVADLRAAMLRTVTPADLAAIVAALVQRAKAGDVAAARELFDRCLGRPRPVDADEPGDGGDVVLRCPPPRVLGERAEPGAVRVCCVVPGRER